MTLITPANPETLNAAASALKSGRLVAFPTETVYGLGADATQELAVARIFAAKARPQFNPLIIHVPNLTIAEQIVIFTPVARRLAQEFWPGPLTLVLPRTTSCSVSLLAGAGLDSLAIRIPAHPIAQALLKISQCPLAAPSANRSGHVSPTTASHVASEKFGSDVAMILDGGACQIGIESTVLDLTSSPTLLRPGGISLEDLIAKIGDIRIATEDSAAPRSPGMMERHYAPSRPLRLNARDPHPGEVLLGFGPTAPPTAALNLSLAGSVVEAASNLFAMIRNLDRPDISGIAVMPIPTTGLGQAINDRLRRAALGSTHNDNPQ